MTTTKTNLPAIKSLLYDKHVSESDFNIAMNALYGTANDDSTKWMTHKLWKNTKMNAEEVKDGIDNWKNKSAASFQSSLFDKMVTLNKVIIYEAPPVTCLSSLEKYILHTKCQSPYAKAISDCFGTKGDVCSILQHQHCGFFDVIPIPLPIDSNLRKMWATNPNFIISGKRLFVHLYEWAWENFTNELKTRKILINNEDCKIAIGIPKGNADTLYMYFACSADKGFCEQHSLTTIRTKPEGLWLPPYKNYVIGSSNSPIGALMALALK